MNIWMLNHYADSPDGQATRDYDRGRELVARGHQVTIFSSSFSQYKLRDDKLALGQSHKTEVFDGVRFVWVRTTPYQGNDRRRVFNMLSFAWRSYWIGRGLKEKPDVIIGTSVHLLTPLAAYLLARAKHAGFFFVVTDLWPQTLVEMGGLPERHPITWGLRRLEKFLYRKAERILSLLPNVQDYIAGLGIPREKVVWIPNGVDVRYFAEVKPYSGGDPSNFTVMYLGGHAASLGLDVVLDAAKILQDAGENCIKFVLVGDGAEKPRLIQRSQELGLRNIEFRGVVPKRELYKEMEKADALLHHYRNLPSLKFGISYMKVFDYLACARPIIFASSGSNNPVEEAHAGITVPPENPDAMVQAIKRLVAMSPDERIQMGRNGYAFVKANYDIPILATRLEGVLQTALSSPRGK